MEKLVDKIWDNSVIIALFTTVVIVVTTFIYIDLNNMLSESNLEENFWASFIPAAIAIFLTMYLYLLSKEDILQKKVEITEMINYDSNYSGMLEQYVDNILSTFEIGLFNYYGGVLGCSIGRKDGRVILCTIDEKCYLIIAEKFLSDLEKEIKKYEEQILNECTEIISVIKFNILKKRKIKRFLKVCDLKVERKTFGLPGIMQKVNYIVTKEEITALMQTENFKMYDTFTRSEKDINSYITRDVYYKFLGDEDKNFYLKIDVMNAYMLYSPNNLSAFRTERRVGVIEYIFHRLWNGIDNCNVMRFRKTDD